MVGKALGATGCVAAAPGSNARLTAGACGHGTRERMALRRAQGQLGGRHASDRLDSLRAAGAMERHPLRLSFSFPNHGRACSTLFFRHRLFGGRITLGSGPAHRPVALHHQRTRADNSAQQPRAVSPSLPAE